MHSLVRQVLIGTGLGALFLGGLVYVAGRGKADALGKLLCRNGINAPMGVLAGAVLGAGLGTVVGFLGMKYHADLASFSQEKGWTFFARIPEGMLAPYQTLLDESGVRSPRNLMP